MASLLVRCAIVVVSLAAVAWLMLSIRALDLTAEGQAVTGLVRDGKLDPAELERGRDAFQAARRFNPDVTPLRQEAFLLTLVGRNREALELTERAAADEPENRDAWAFVYFTAQAVGDRRSEARAARALRELDPLNAPVILRRRLGGD